ncbi:MAG: translation initiation factor IF-2 N-terminal domain-containing protein, partial [Candidatus Avelusimicrobium sp.]
MTTKKTTNSEEESSAKKKTAAKKTTASKTAAKKPAAKKTTTAKKTTASKTAAKKPAAKKTTTAKPRKTAAKAKAEEAAAAKREKTQTAQVSAPQAETKAEVTPAEHPVAPQAATPKAEKPAETKPAPAAAHVQPKAEAKPVQTVAPQARPQEPVRPQAAPVQQPKPQQPAHHNRPQGPNFDRHGHAKPVQPQTPKKDEKVIKIVGQPTVKELAEKMNIKTNDFIKKLMMMGIFATINQRLEKDMIELIVDECGFKAELAEEDLTKEAAALMETQDDPVSLKPRSPVITIMGHVDHGKTSLLDAIRKSNVVAGEAGAITQHIGAYRVKTPRGTLTFLDTPGHEAFTAMRARGAQATDIVVLVVSATDGIMPQTIESMEHAKAAGTPIIVAVNKIDLPGANVDRVKQDLAARGLVPEEWQGTTIFVEISAKKNINIDKLLEMLALQAEMMELKANPDRPGVGVILESKRDSKRGVVATVLVQKGTMKVGDP